MIDAAHSVWANLMALIASISQFLSAPNIFLHPAHYEAQRTGWDGLIILPFSSLQFWPAPCGPVISTWVTLPYWQTNPLGPRLVFWVIFVFAMALFPICIVDFLLHDYGLIVFCIFISFSYNTTSIFSLPTSIVVSNVSWLTSVFSAQCNVSTLLLGSNINYCVLIE